MKLIYAAVMVCLAWGALVAQTQNRNQAPANNSIEIVGAVPTPVKTTNDDTTADKPEALPAKAELPEAPIRFRGAHLGQSLFDYVDCSSGKGRKLKQSYRLHGDLCRGKKGAVYNTKSVGLMNPKTHGEIFWFDNFKLNTIKILIPDEDFEKVKYDLSEKLGPPASEVPQVFQNGFGARWEFEQGFWQKGNIVAAAGVRVTTLGGSAIRGPFSNKPATQGIIVTIMDAATAKVPSSRPNVLD
jgi:hypothetical protein